MKKILLLLLILVLPMSFARASGIDTAMFGGYYTNLNRVEMYLTLWSDSFRLVPYGNSTFPINYSGKWSREHDTLRLMAGDANWAKFFISPSRDTLSLVGASDERLFIDSALNATTYYRGEAFYPDGKLRMERVLFSVVKLSGAPVRYQEYNYDRQGNLTNIVPYYKGQKHGKEYAYYPLRNIVAASGHLSLELLTQRKKGRWRYGLKTGKWRYYDNSGNLVKTERYSRKGRLK